MKKIIFFIIFLTSCSFNSDSVYWTENVSSNYEEISYDKDYSFEEYEKILNKYNDRKDYPSINK